jgi:hypothetical protein
MLADGLQPRIAVFCQKVFRRKLAGRVPSERQVVIYSGAPRARALRAASATVSTDVHRARKRGGRLGVLFVVLLLSLNKNHFE